MFFYFSRVFKQKHALNYSSLFFNENFLLQVYWVDELPGGPISSARVRHTLFEENEQLLLLGAVFAEQESRGVKEAVKHGGCWRSEKQILT